MICFIVQTGVLPRTLLMTFFHLPSARPLGLLDTLSQAPELEAVASLEALPLNIESAGEQDSMSSATDRVSTFESSIISMGFSPKSVSLAVGRYGEDYDKVLSLVLKVQQLVEAGHDPSSSFEVLMLFEDESSDEGKVKKSATFLEHTSSLKQMGFTKDQAFNALKSSSTNLDEAISMLLSGD